MFTYIKKMFTFAKHIKQFLMKNLFSLISAKSIFLQYSFLFAYFLTLISHFSLFIIKNVVFYDKTYKPKKWRQGIWVLCKTNLDT